MSKKLNSAAAGKGGQSSYGRDALTVLLGNAVLGETGEGLHSWFEIRADGIHVIEKPDVDVETTDQITGDYAHRRHVGPVLAIPCSLEEFRAFDRMTGLFTQLLQCGEETADHIAEISQRNSAAGELAAALMFDRLPEVRVDAEGVLVAPLGRMLAQEVAILETIKGLGLNPRRLPKPPAGKSGVKAQVRLALQGRDGVFVPGAETFQKAWQRLRNSGEIVDEPAA